MLTIVQYQFVIWGANAKMCRDIVMHQVHPKGVRNMTIEARFAQLYWSDQETIGSGLEEINGPVRTELGAQIKYQF